MAVIPGTVDSSLTLLLGLLLSYIITVLVELFLVMDVRTPFSSISALLSLFDIRAELLNLRRLLALSTSFAVLTSASAYSFSFLSLSFALILSFPSPLDHVPLPLALAE